MRIASIDIGSNTVLLLIAETTGKEIIPLRNEYSMPRLGKGLLPGGNISEDRIAELEIILTEYKKLIESYGCELVIAKATSAMRRAANSNDIVERIKKVLNIEIEVIPGEDEARLSFLGAISAVKSSSMKMVIDVGGGSTEIILGDENNIHFSKSFQIGTVSLTESYFKHNPPLKNEIDEMNYYIQETFAELKTIVPDNVDVIAVAGTPTSLSSMKQNLKDYYEDKIENSILTLEDFEIMNDKIRKLTSEEILQTYGNVVKGRNDVIFSGSLLLYNLLKMNGLGKMIVSGKGIRYGAVVDFINRQIKQ